MISCSSWYCICSMVEYFVISVVSIVLIYDIEKIGNVSPEADKSTFFMSSSVFRAVLAIQRKTLKKNFG